MFICFWYQSHLLPGAMPLQYYTRTRNDSSSFFVFLPHVQMCCLVTHICIDKKNLYTPHPDGLPSFSLPHPPINPVATSNLVGNIYPIHSIVVIIINLASKESQLHSFILFFIENTLHFFNPLQLGAGHRKKVYWLCVIHTEGNKVWAFCITL